MGFVLGSLLWNIMDNDAYNLPVPKETTMLFYADDIPVVEIADYIYESIAVGANKDRLDRTRLGVGKGKREMVRIKKRH